MAKIVGGGQIPKLKAPGGRKKGALRKAKKIKKVPRKLKIKVAKRNKIPKSKLKKPSKRGNAPTFKKDGSPVEIHHVGQNPKGPFKEMHKQDHRGVGNDKINHPNKSKPSKVDRKEFNNAKKEYWKNEYDNWNKRD